MCLPFCRFSKTIDTLLQKKVLQPTVKKTEDLLPNGFGNCKKSKTVCVNRLLASQGWTDFNCETWTWTSGSSQKATKSHRTQRGSNTSLMARILAFSMCAQYLGTKGGFTLKSQFNHSFGVSLSCCGGWGHMGYRKKTQLTCCVWTAHSWHPDVTVR